MGEALPAMASPTLPADIHPGPFLPPRVGVRAGIYTCAWGRAGLCQTAHCRASSWALRPSGAQTGAWIGSGLDTGQGDEIPAALGVHSGGPSRRASCSCWPAPLGWAPFPLGEVGAMPRPRGRAARGQQKCSQPWGAQGQAPLPSCFLLEPPVGKDQGNRCTKEKEVWERRREPPPVAESFHRGFPFHMSLCRPGYS